MMHSIRPLFVAILALALGAYAFDCEAATTPEQAMPWCKAMPCSSHGHHGQDCCKTMPTMHAPFVQPSSVQSVSFSPVVFAVMAASWESGDLDSFSLTKYLWFSPPPPPLSPPL